MDELEDQPVGRKSRLYRSFVERKHGPLTFSRAALAGIVQGLRPAFLDHQSTSLMVIGSNSDALAMVFQAQQILLRESRSEWLLSGGRDRALVGRITGNLNDSDAAGLVSLADQFCLRPGRDRNLNATLEDLGVFLQRCRADGTPALVVVEDFHLFAHQKRQTLIYTLLDLLHRPDYLFAVVGVTERLDAFHGLEKRVSSRMSSQNVVVPFPSVEEICAELHWLLTLRPRARRKRARSPSTGAAAEGDADDDAWRREYNASVARLFGDFALAPLVVPRHRLVGDGDDTGDGDGDGAAAAPAAPRDDPLPPAAALHLFACEPRAAAAPAAAALLRRQLDFGRGRRHFAKTALQLLTLLPAARPLLSLELLQRALEMNTPPSLAQLLASLSLAELSLFAAMARLQCQPGAALKVPRQLVMEDVLGDYDRLTGGLLSAAAARGAALGQRQSLQQVIESLRRLVALGVVSLWTGLRGRPLPAALLQAALLPSVVVTLEHAADELAAAFRALVMPERVRAAVLQPLVPLVYAAPPSAINAAPAPSGGSAAPPAEAVATFAQANSHAPLLPQVAPAAAGVAAYKTNQPLPLRL
eukprot:gene2784-2023_t